MCSVSPAGPNHPPIAVPVISIGRKLEPRRARLAQPPDGCADGVSSALSSHLSPNWVWVSEHSSVTVVGLEHPLAGMSAWERLQ